MRSSFVAFLGGDPVRRVSVFFQWVLRPPETLTDKVPVMAS